MVYKFETLSVELDQSVLFVAIKNDPCNIMSVKMMENLTRLGQKIADDDAVRVLVLQSQDPDFLVAHFDTDVVVKAPRTGPSKWSWDLSPLQTMCATNPFATGE